MSFQSWQETLSTVIADGTQIVSSTAETIMIPDYTFPTNYMFPGRTVKMTLVGRLSTVVTTPGTLTFRVRWGGVGGTALAASAAIALNATAQTSDTFRFETIFVCRSVGTSGSALVTGQVLLGAGAATNVVNFLPATAPAAVTIDTTASSAFSHTAQFSVSNAANNLTIHQAILTALN